MKKLALLSASMLMLAACDTAPPPVPGYTAATTFCKYPFWIEYRPYAAGSIVTYRGRLYFAKHENPGYIPDVSTYFWAEVSVWAAGDLYLAGSVVNHTGKVYVASVDKPGTAPGEDPQHWAEQGCPRR